MSARNGIICAVSLLSPISCVLCFCYSHGENNCWHTPTQNLANLILNIAKKNNSHGEKKKQRQRHCADSICTDLCGMCQQKCGIRDDKDDEDI